MCRVANAEYSLANAHGETSAMVGPSEVSEARARVNRWRRQGIGLRTIELWTGVSRSALRTLVDGKHPNGNGPSRRMSRENYEAIMAAKPRLRGGALTTSHWVLEALGELRERGWTYARIAEESGLPLSTVHSLAYRRPGKVTKGTSDALCGLRRHERHGRWSDHTGYGSRRRGPMEDWEWQEARADWLNGTGADALAERYGVATSTILAHMKARGLERGAASVARPKHLAV